MFNLAHDYARNDMTAYVKLQEADSLTHRRLHLRGAQQEVGTRLLDDMTTVIPGGTSSVNCATVDRRRQFS